MKNRAFLVCFALLILIAALTLACGSPTRMAQSVTVSPLSADAQTYPNGQVQFTATGYYNVQPSPVAPLTATWGACYQNGATTGVTVSATGLAQCVSGAPGTYTVWAYVVNSTTHGVCNGLVLPCGGACDRVVGTAALTCP